MGLGSTAKKVQQMVDIAEELYAKLNEMRAQLNDLRGTVEETGSRVETLEAELRQQRALVEAIAAEHDIDVESLRAEAAGVDGEEDADAETDAEADGEAAGVEPEP